VQLADCKINIISAVRTPAQEADPFPGEPTDRRHFLGERALIALRVLLVFFSSQLRCLSRIPRETGTKFSVLFHESLACLPTTREQLLRALALCMESIPQGLRSPSGRLRALQLHVQTVLALAFYRAESRCTVSIKREREGFPFPLQIFAQRVARAT